MILTYTDKTYRITRDAVSMIENALGNPNLIQISVTLGCTIMIAPNQYGITLLPNKDFQMWNLTGINTALTRAEAHYIYARLRRTEKEAMLLFSVNNYEIDGKIKNVENSEPSKDYYYIKIGKITKTDSVTLPTLDREISYDGGFLGTDGWISDNSDSWKELFAVTTDNFINALKRFTSFTVQGTLTIIGRIVLNDKKISSIATSTDEDSFIDDETIPTTKYLKDNFSTILEEKFLSKIKNDKSAGHITFEQGIYVKGGNKENEQPILEEGNSIYEDTNGIIEESLPAPAPLTSTLGGLDNVDGIVDVPSNKDVILIKKAGSSEWTQEDKTVSDTILEAPKDGKQYARKDGEWSIVEAGTANVPEWALQPEKPAYTALEVAALSLNGGRMNNTNLVIDLNANLLEGKKASDFSLKIDLPTKLSQLTNDANYVQDANYVHTDNNFTSLLKGQLSDLNIEYLNAANKLNYQRAKTFFSKAYQDPNSIWGFVRYFNNLPTLTATQVKITGVRSDFNGDQISDSYMNLSGATQTLAGIMTAADKTKLDGIATGATKVIVDSAMSETSLNPVQNKIITSRFIQVEGRATNLETQYSALSNTLSPISVAWNKRGTKDGFLILGENGIISSQYLPSYVDDVVEVYATYDKSATGVLSNIKLYTNSTHTTAVVPESGKIYIDITAGKPPYQFRWSGTTYIDLNTGGLILGTIAGTAFEGNKGNVLYTNFGEGVNLTGTQKSRNFFNIVGDEEPYLRGIGIGTYSDTGLNVNYEIGYFDGTKDSDHFNIKAATKTQAGLMSAPDKTKLDNLVSFELPSAIIYNIKAFQAESYVNVIYDFMYADGTPDSDSFTIDAATSTQAGVITATDKIKLDNAVTLNTNQTITGLKYIDNKLVILGRGGNVGRDITLDSGRIAIKAINGGWDIGLDVSKKDTSDVLAKFGFYGGGDSLNYAYIGLGYEDSKNWITFTPSLTTIKTDITSLTGSLKIPDGGGIGKGIQTSTGNGLIMYSGTTATYLSQPLGTTYIRSGNTDLVHRKGSNDYTIWDGNNTPNPFCYRGSASVDHVDLTSTTVGAANFVNYNSGAYMVSRGGSTAMYIKFQGAGSTSGLELYTNYLDGSPLQFRKIVDNNRISGPWSIILDQKNWSSFITFDKLSDKPLISVDATPNSIVKRSTNGFILGGNTGITFTDTSKNSDAKNAWTITTNTSYGGTSYDLKISQYITGTKGNLLLNGVPVATAGNRYIMTLYLINASGLDENTYYPVTIPLYSGGNFRIEVLTSLNGTVPSWSTHASGFTVRFIEEVQGSGWGATPVRRRVIDSVSSYVRDAYPPIGKVTQMSNSSTEVIWVRGGGLYYFYTSGTGSNLITPVLRTTSYTANSQTVSPIPVADKDNSIVRNVVMNDDAVYEPNASSIVRRDSNGYVKGVRFYTTTPDEDYAISHVAFFYNSDGFIRKTPLSGLNRQLRFDKLINILSGSNEFNILPITYSASTLWLNYRSLSYEDTASTINYVYIGNGQKGKAYVSAKGFEREGSTDRYALTGAGGHMIITQDATVSALVQRNDSGNIFATTYAFNNSNSVYSPNRIELYSETTPYIDFHYQNSAADYTARIINDAIGHLNIAASAGLAINGGITSTGFIKSDSSNIYMLLGGGSHKLLSDFVDRTTNQSIGGIKSFYSTNTSGSWDTRAILLREVNLVGAANDTPAYAPALAFVWSGLNASVVSIRRDGNFHFTDSNSGSTNYKYLYCNGIVKSGSSDSYALLGGGGHLAISEAANGGTLVKRNNNGYIYATYFNQSTGIETSTSITNIIFENNDGFFRKATLGRVTDTIRLATQTVKGLMSPEDKKKVDLFDDKKFLRRDIDDDALGHITFHKGIYVDGGSYDGQSIMEADGVNGIMEADGVNGIMEYSAPAPIAISMTLGELTNVSSSVNTATSSKVMFVKGAGESVWTQETMTPNILKGFTDTRSIATVPNDYNNKFTVVGLKTNSAIGNSLTANTYSYLIGYRGWSDYSGGNSHEISFNDDGIYHRTGTTTSWNSWTKFLTSSNWSSYITIPTALKNPNAITFTGAVTGTYDGSAAKTINIPTMPDLSPYALKDFSNVTIQSLGQNGYCKFPNGLLIQWGVNITGTAAQRTVSLPVSFYDSSYVVTATVFTSSSEITQAVSVTAIILSKSTSSFIGCTRYVGTSSNAGYSTWGFNWTAIGRWK